MYELFPLLRRRKKKEGLNLMVEMFFNILLVLNIKEETGWGGLVQRASETSGRAHF
jgi:hypothetical protein